MTINHTQLTRTYPKGLPRDVWGCILVRCSPRARQVCWGFNEVIISQPIWSRVITQSDRWFYVKPEHLRGFDRDRFVKEELLKIHGRWQEDVDMTGQLSGDSSEDVTSSMIVVKSPMEGILRIWESVDLKEENLLVLFSHLNPMIQLTQNKQDVEMLGKISLWVCKKIFENFPPDSVFRIFQIMFERRKDPMLRWQPSGFDDIIGELLRTLMQREEVEIFNFIDQYLCDILHSFEEPVHLRKSLALLELMERWQERLATIESRGFIYSEDYPCSRDGPELMKQDFAKVCCHLVNKLGHRELEDGVVTRILQKCLSVHKDEAIDLQIRAALEAIKKPPIKEA